MKIGLDLRCLPADGTEGAGVAHAARLLCAELAKDEAFKWIAYVPKKAAWNSCARIELPDVSASSLKQALSESPCDLLFVPSGAVSLGLDVPAIPWVHDLIIFDHPEWFPQGWLKRQFTTRLFLHGLKKAPIVFAVSEYTKQAIVRHAHLPSDQIKVTHEGGDDVLAKLDNEKLIYEKSAAVNYCQKFLGLPRPFVLCLGTVEPRKNLAMLIKAWKKTPLIKHVLSGVEGGGRGDFVLNLVIAGQDGWKFEDVTQEINGLSDAQRPYLHRLEKINDEERRQLLLAAQAVAIPSLDEGFGLVALEALQAGTHVITSNRGALPEVIGKAGILLDPQDEKAWADALDRILHPERKKVLNSVGLGAVVQALKGKSNIRPVMTTVDEDGLRSRLEQAKKFSWEKSAKIVLQGLKSLADV